MYSNLGMYQALNMGPPVPVVSLFIGFEILAISSHMTF